MLSLLSRVWSQVTIHNEMEAVMNLDIEVKADIQEVAGILERTLQVLIYRLLEKMIEEESADGDFVLSTIPATILNELKQLKNRCRHSDINKGTDLDQYVLTKAVSGVERILEYAAEHYHQTFHKLILALDLSSEFNFAYDTFVKVCKKFFEEEVTWYRIASLLCFGAEIALFVIKQGSPGVEAFLKKIVHYVIEFVVKEEIADWITHHGGCMTMIDVFDSCDCKERANHILTIMALTELTNMDIWMERIAFVALVAGVCFTIGKFVT